MIALRPSPILTVWDTVAGVVFPRECHLCRSRLSERREIAQHLCQACLDELPANEPPFCPRCGASLRGAGGLAGCCEACRGRRFAFRRAWAPFRYGASMRTCLHHFKYHGRTCLGPVLGRALLTFARQHLPTRAFDSIVPVPLHPARLRERTYNQAALLARVVADGLGVPIQDRLLTRVRRTHPQSHLPRAARLANLAESIAWDPRPAVRGHRVLVVDDLLTTGATAHACAEGLLLAGARRVDVLALARG